MMEEIEIDDKHIIVIINNIKGNINRLNLILEKLKENLDIDYLFLTGEVFNLQTKEEDLLKIEFKETIIIFDLSPYGEKIKLKSDKNNLLKNFIFLGKSGIFTPPDSCMNIAYLSGNEIKEFLEKNNNTFNQQYSNKYYKYQDIIYLINNFLLLKNNKKENKIDFFLINSFPQSLYNRYSNIIKQESKNNNIILNEDQINNTISYSLNFLLYIMNPRYIITSVDDFYYKNAQDIVMNCEGYRTFFYNLGYLEDKKNINENFYVAFDYKSLNNMDKNEISLMEKEYQERLGHQFMEDKNIFKYFNNFEVDNNKSLIQNFDEYLKLCFNENKMKSIKDNSQESKPLFISNFNFNSSEEEIKNYLINKYGPFKQIKFLTNKENNKFNGKVIVQFNDVNSMKEMLNNSNKEKFNDRIIKTVIYVPRDQLNNPNNINNNINTNINIIHNANNTNVNNTNDNNNNVNNNYVNNNNRINNNINNNNNQSNNNIYNNNNQNKNNIYNNNNNSNKSNDDCWFCYDKKDDSDKKYILEEFNHFYLSFSKGPINKYHFLIIPKRHISFYINLTNEEKTESEMIIQFLKNFLNSNGCDYIIFEKNLKYNFSKSIHLLINVIGFENKLMSKVNEFTENFVIEEKFNQYMILYNDINIYLYTYIPNDEYIYINIPYIYKGKIIRKIILLKIKEYKIDYPRKLICMLINKEERINWRDTLNTGEEFLNEIKENIKKYLDIFFSNN